MSRVLLPWTAPYDVPGLLDFLGMRAVPGVEEVFDGGYRRAVAGRVMEVRAADGGFLVDERDTRSAQALLDLDMDPFVIKNVLGVASVTNMDPHRTLIRDGRIGRRVPGTTSPEELAFRAVLGQQVSVAGARTLTGRLVHAFGAPLSHPVGAVTHAFPTAAAFAEVNPDTLPMPKARGRAFVNLAKELADGLDLHDREKLLSLPGIGPWTADYIAFRALGDRDAWLPTDLGVKHAMKNLGLTNADADRWRPYRAYAIVHLWAST
ncbi:MAG: AraC family transcriptional regulator [Solirubrobacteraceae bacterium]|jgi:AraC family transcriptional regulator of adaptative response / DNA-3-methyladenine glycosylase II|nr:AraC family transcriptional regulator [Solirubrobacteraceae bacterium]